VDYLAVGEDQPEVPRSAAQSTLGATLPNCSGGVAQNEESLGKLDPCDSGLRSAVLARHTCRHHEQKCGCGKNKDGRECVVQHVGAMLEHLWSSGE